MRYLFANVAAMVVTLLICSPAALVIYARHWQVEQWHVAAVVIVLYVALLVAFARLFASRKGA